MRRSHQVSVAWHDVHRESRLMDAREERALTIARKGGIKFGRARVASAVAVDAERNGR